jgi:release factor glutamine methyltransferase
MNADPLRPSEYSAALIRQAGLRAAWVRGAAVLEMGLGSGVVLAACGALGAASLTGIDIEPEAVERGGALLDALGHGAIARLHAGDMWQPVAGQRFDLVLANLPHFPMPPVEVAGRRPSWSSGGADGRLLLDRFLAGLAAHLAPGGRAILMHNAFIGLDATRAMLAAGGLGMRVAASLLLPIAAEKFARMPPAVRADGPGRGLLRYGPHVFGEVAVLEIGAAGSLG